MDPVSLTGSDGLPLKPGRVVLAPGGQKHLLVEGSGQWISRLKDGPLINGHCPSVACLFRSVAKTDAVAALSVIKLEALKAKLHEDDKHASFDEAADAGEVDLF